MQSNLIWSIIHTYIHACIHTYIHINIHIVCQIYIIDPYIYLFVCLWIDLSIVYRYIYIYTYTYTHIYIYIHIYIYVHTHLIYDRMYIEQCNSTKGFKAWSRLLRGRCSPTEIPHAGSVGWPEGLDDTMDDTKGRAIPWFWQVFILHYHIWSPDIEGRDSSI